MLDLFNSIVDFFKNFFADLVKGFASILDFACGDDDVRTSTDATK